MDIDAAELIKLMTAYGFSVRDGLDVELHFYYDHGETGDVVSHTLYTLKNGGIELTWYRFLYSNLSEQEILKHHHRKLPGLSKTLKDLTFDGNLNPTQVALLVDLIFMPGNHRRVYEFSDYVELIRMPDLTYLERVDIARTAVSPLMIKDFLSQKVPVSLALELLT